MSFTPSVGKFRNARDINGNDIGLRPVPLFVNQKALSANTNYADTVPTGANMVIIAADVNIFVNCNATAAITDKTDGSASELNPGGYAFESGNAPSTINVITSATGGHVTLAYYRV